MLDTGFVSKNMSGTYYVIRNDFFFLIMCAALYNSPTPFCFANNHI